jgi:hypothetical protein
MAARRSTITATLLAVCALLSGAGWTTAVARQQASRNWRYAYVVFRPSQAAQICYVEAAGCRMEEIAVEPVPSASDILMTDGGATRSRAMTKAVATLGARGWELVMEAPAVGDASKNALYFKRAD